MYRYIIYCWFSYLYIPHRLCLQWVLHTPKIGVHQARHLIAGCRRGVFLHLQGFVSEDRVSIFCTKKQQHKKNQISSCRVYYSMAHQRGLYHVIMSATSRTKSEPSAALTQVFSVEWFPFTMCTRLDSTQWSQPSEPIYNSVRFGVLSRMGTKNCIKSQPSGSLIRVVSAKWSRISFGTVRWARINVCTKRCKLWRCEVVHCTVCTNIFLIYGQRICVYRYVYK
jgi:hypothetical protein